MTPPFSYALAVAWTLALTAALISSVIAITALFPAFAKNLLWVGLWEGVVYLGATWLLARRVAGATRVADFLALKPAAPGLIGVALALGLSLQIPTTSLLVLAERVFPTPPEVFAERLAQLEPSSKLHALALFSMVALAVPLVEELFFRGALLGALLADRARSVFAACAVVAVCFVVSHLDPHFWFPLLLVAAALSHLRYLSGSLWPGFALHASFNGTTLLAVFSGKAPQTPAPEMSLMVVLSGWVISGGLWWLAQRLAQSREVRA